MSKFADCLGREWVFRIVLADLRPLREMGIDCAKVMTAMESLPDILFGDAERLANAVYFLLKTDVPADDFAAGIDGPTLEAMGVAFIEACCDFFPNSRISRAMKGKVREGLDKLGETLAERISSGGVGNSPESASAGPTPAA